ncbi:MAG: F0F1 ATP synthase subunit epsilon [Chloroflexota bacterium]
MATLSVEIVTAERRVYSDEADILIAPGAQGQLGILPSHAPLVTTLQPGELRLRKGSTEVSMCLSGGFMEVFANKVTILADACERSEEIDTVRAEAAMKRAEELLRHPTPEVDTVRAEAALRRSLVRLKVAQRRRRRTTPT